MHSAAKFLLLHIIQNRSEEISMKSEEIQTERKKTKETQIVKRKKKHI